MLSRNTLGRSCVLIFKFRHPDLPNRASLGEKVVFGKHNLMGSPRFDESLRRNTTLQSHTKPERNSARQDFFESR